MNQVPIIGQFNAFIQQFANTDKLKLTSSDYRISEPAVKPIDGLTIAPVIQQFYSTVDYMRCRWTVDDTILSISYLDKEIDFVGGEVTITNRQQFYDSLASHQRSPLLNENWINQTDLTDFVPFDFADGDFAVCFLKKQGRLNDQLYFVSFDTEQTSDLEIGLDTYLRTGIQNAFFYGWQQAIFLHDQTAKAKLDFYLPQLFSKNEQEP